MQNQPKTPNSNRGFDAQFLSIAPHYKPLLLPGVIVSIDSLRVKFCYRSKVYLHDKKKAIDPLNYLYDKLNSAAMYCSEKWDIHTYEHSFKLGSYYQTITFECENCSFAVLLGRYYSDSGSKLYADEAILDFNPNKVPAHIWSRVYRVLLENAAQAPEVQRFDLAFDFPVTRSSLELVQRSGSQHTRIASPAGAVTEYTGERSQHGAVKLYNKAAEVQKEMGLVSDIPMTRLELTLDPKKYKGIQKHFPEILEKVPMQQDMEFQKLPFEVKAVILHPELLPVLKASCSRNTFARYKAQLRSYGQTYYTLPEDGPAQVDRYVHGYLASFTSPNYRGLTEKMQNKGDWVTQYGLSTMCRTIK